VKVENWGNYITLGATRDDAAGEAFDKVAKLLGLGYPGGHKIDTLAKSGNWEFRKFPKAQFKSGNYEFSFSGLKTAVSLYLKEQEPEFIHKHLADICATFQENVVEVLVDTTLRAAEDFGMTTVAIGGGVAANSRLRGVFEYRCRARGVRALFPELKYCTDNAAMIAAAGCFRLGKGESSDFDLKALPYWPLGIGQNGT
jgi:N6-L-threonylcarbamoyladenine synthase